MATEQVFEEEFDYHLLFQPLENPTPEPDECNLIEKYLIPSCSLSTINDPIEACGGGDQFSVVFQGD